MNERNTSLSNGTAMRSDDASQSMERTHLPHDEHAPGPNGDDQQLRRPDAAEPIESASTGSVTPGSGRDIKGSDEADIQVLAASFKLLSDETRLRVLSLLLKSGELNVRTLCEHLDQSQPAVSHHLAMLRDAGLVRARRDGKHNYYRCLTDRLESLVDSSWREMMGNPPPAK